MPERLDITRERYGMQNTGPVYRDAVFLIRDRNGDNAAITSTGFLTKAAFDALKPTGNQLQTANIATGMVDMAAGDGLELMFGGDVAGSFSYAVLAYDPCFLSTDAGKQVITGYSERIVLAGVATVSATQIGAAGVAALGGTGMLNADRIADAISVLNSGAQLAAAPLVNVENVTVASTTSPAQIRVGARGSRFLRVLTGPRTTTTVAFCWGKRIQGSGQGTMRA